MVSHWQNVAALAGVGSAVAYLAWRFGRAVRNGGKSTCAACVRCRDTGAKNADGKEVIPLDTRLQERTSEGP